MQATTSNKLDFLRKELENRILNGIWNIGDQIPSENELATEFGCSRGTVSKAVACLVHDGLVQRRTRAGTRVMADSIGKLPTPFQLDAYAFIYPNEQHEGIWRIVQGFHQAARTVKQKTALLTTGTSFRKEAEIIGRLSEFDVKGAVVYPVLPEPQDRNYFSQMLLQCRLPVVLVDVSLPDLARPAVVVDGLHAGYTMTRHLLAQGLKRIGFLSNYAWTQYMRDRYLGYRQALREAGLEEWADWTLLEPGMRPDFEDPLKESRKLAKQFLSRATEVQGIVCATDFLALGCLQVAQELEIRVPEQLKVAGIDDYAPAAVSTPSLTTYHVPYEEMGRQAFDVLNRLLHQEQPPPLETQVRGEMVIRRSA